MFEYNISKQEQILNMLLDKINKSGRNSLSQKELSFLKNYPNETIENDKEGNEVLIGSPISNKIFSSDSGYFEFRLSDIDIETISNDIIISGYMSFPNNNVIQGYFLVNQVTQVIFPYFIKNDKNAYDFTNNNNDDFYSFLEEIYFELSKKI